MFKIRILSIGKTKEEWLKDGLEEYSKRLSRDVEIQWILARNEKHLESLAESEDALICLDPDGEMLTSKTFSEFLTKRLVSQGSRAAFLIGGAEGIPESIKSKNGLISLSRMTFTHQMTRLILLEQIYRALEIAKGSNYHK